MLKIFYVITRSVSTRVSFETAQSGEPTLRHSQKATSDANLRRLLASIVVYRILRFDCGMLGKWAIFDVVRCSGSIVSMVRCLESKMNLNQAFKLFKTIEICDIQNLILFTRGICFKDCHVEKMYGDHLI